MKALSSIALWPLLSASLLLCAQSPDTPLRRAASTEAMVDAPSAMSASISRLEIRLEPPIPLSARRNVEILLPSTRLALAQTQNANSAGLKPVSAEQPKAAEEPTAAKAEQRVFDTKYWVVNGALIGSFVANTEYAMQCQKCTSIPDSLHHRSFFYGAGAPVAFGFAYWGYELKKGGHRWWYVPTLAATAANTLLAGHWASRR